MKRKETVLDQKLAMAGWVLTKKEKNLSWKTQRTCWQLHL